MVHQAVRAPWIGSARRRPYDEWNVEHAHRPRCWSALCWWWLAFNLDESPGFLVVNENWGHLTYAAPFYVGCLLRLEQRGLSVPDPFTIRIFVPDGDPDGVRLIDRMNWTGIGLAFPRAKWPEIKQRPEFARTGVYILDGYRSVGDDDDFPTIYIGQGDVVRQRVDSHFRNKDFWDRGIVFISTSGGLNRAHVTWLEYALVNRAAQTKRCHLDNGNVPQEPFLTEAERADTKASSRKSSRFFHLSVCASSSSPSPSRHRRRRLPRADPSKTHTTPTR